MTRPAGVVVAADHAAVWVTLPGCFAAGPPGSLPSGPVRGGLADPNGDDALRAGFPDGWLRGLPARDAAARGVTLAGWRGGPQSGALAADPARLAGRQGT